MKAKKLIALVCCLAMVFTLSISAFAYSDTKTHWAADSIDTWSEYGVLNGDGDSFRPNDPIKRGEMAKVMATMLKLTDKADNTFTDLEGKWYADYVLLCVKAGIIKGYDDNTFRGEKTISREEAFVMVGRSLGIKEADACDRQFDDLGTVSSWAKGYIYALINAGYINGVSDSLLGLKNDITRAAVVTVIDNSIKTYDPASGKFTLADPIKKEETKTTGSGGGHSGGNTPDPDVKPTKPSITINGKDYIWDKDTGEYYYYDDAEEKVFVGMEDIKEDASESGMIIIDGDEYEWSDDLEEWFTFDDDEEEKVIGDFETVIGGSNSSAEVD